MREYNVAALEHLVYRQKGGFESIIQMRVYQIINGIQLIGNASASSGPRNINQPTSEQESKERTHGNVVFELHV